MLSQLEKLPPEAVKVLEVYARKLLEADEKNIISLAVYGSAAGGNFVPGKSNVNLAVVVGELMLKQLKIYQGLAPKKKKQAVVPLFLTQKQLKSVMNLRLKLLMKILEDWMKKSKK